MFYNYQSLEKLLNDIISHPTPFTYKFTFGEQTADASKNTKAEDSNNRIDEYVVAQLVRKVGYADQYVLELPGFSKENVTVELKEEGDTGTYYVRVDAKIHEVKPEAEEIYKHRWSEFYIPEDSSLDTITSEMKNGVLTVKVSKLPKSEPFKKTIKVA